MKSIFYIYLIGIVLLARPEGLGQQLGTGTYSSNGKVQNAISIDYHGDISPFVANMKKAFGREFTRKTDLNGYIMEFRNAFIPEWSDKKLFVDIWIQSYQYNHIITFACKERKGMDCLRSDSKSKPVIAAFLKSSFKPPSE